MKKIIFAFVALLVFTACQNNKLKSNEKDLAQKILSEEEILAQKKAIRIEKERLLADSIANLPKGFRFKENRVVDPLNPPVTIDFTKDIPMRKMKLSDIAKKITYISLQVPDDSLFFAPHMGGFVRFTNNNIVLNNNFGIHRFSRTGDYIEHIVNSNIKRRKLSKELLFGYFDKESYRGAWGNHVSTAGNRIFYKFSDYPNEKVSLFQHDLKPGEKTINFKAVQEVSDDGSFTKGEFVTSGKVARLSGTPGLASTQIDAVSDNCYAGISKGLKAYDKGVMFATFNLNGDTLCKFAQFDTLKTPITSSVIRSISTITSWHYKGIYTFKRAFNDTIFRLIPPNRIVPAYVFNFGKHKMSGEDWYHFNRGLNGKIKPESIRETDNFLFMKYKNYSPTSKKLGDEHYALFDKNSNKLFELDFRDEFKNKTYDGPFKDSNWAAGFENDIDGGFPFWPSHITPEGQLAIILKSSTLKKQVNKSDFESGSGNKEQLKAFVKTLSKDNREKIIMIVE